MYSINLTEEDVLEAKTYTPIAHKEAMTRLMAQLCIERANEAEDTPWLGRYRENRMRRQQFLMGVLAQWYLGKNIELSQWEAGEYASQTIPYCMSPAECDRWSGSHVLNQLERLKQSKEQGVKDQVYDLLSDFKLFENMLMGAIRDELERRNDSLGRVKELFEAELSPETLGEALRSIRDGIEAGQPEDEA